MKRKLGDVLAGKTIRSVVNSDNVTIEFTDDSTVQFHAEGSDDGGAWILVDVSHVVTERFDD